MNGFEAIGEVGGGGRPVDGVSGAPREVRRSAVFARSRAARGPGGRREETAPGNKVRDAQASLTRRATAAARGATVARASRLAVPKKRGAVGETRQNSRRVAT